MLLTFAVSGYRSLRRIELPLQRLNIVTGPNGSGKSNLYRALRLLAETTQIIVVSHAEALVDRLSGHPHAALFSLTKDLGETIVTDVQPPPWDWPKR